MVAVPGAGAAAGTVAVVAAEDGAGAASASVALGASDLTGSPAEDDSPAQLPTVKARTAAATSPQCSDRRQRRRRVRWELDVDSGRSGPRPRASEGTQSKLEQLDGSGWGPVAGDTERAGQRQGRNQPATTARSETSVKWVTVAGTTPKASVAATVSASAERNENGTGMRPAAAASSLGFSNHMRAAILP